MRPHRFDARCLLLAMATLVPLVVLAHAYTSNSSRRDSHPHHSMGDRPMSVIALVADGTVGTANDDEIVRVRALNCTDPGGNTSVLFSPDLTPPELAGTAAAMDWWEGCARTLPAHYSHGQRHLLTGSLTGATCTSEERGCKRTSQGGLLHTASSKKKTKQGTQAVSGAAAAMVVNPPLASMPSTATPSAPADGEASAEAVPKAWCSEIYGAYFEAPHLVSLNTKVANGVYKELMVLTADRLKEETIVAARAALGERLCAIVPADDASAATLDQYNLDRVAADAATGTPRLRTIAIRPGVGLLEDTISVVIVMTCGTRPEPFTG